MSRLVCFFGFLFFASAVLFQNCQTIRAEDVIQETTVDQIMGGLQNWHGLKVRVTGFVRLGIGSDSIYESEEAALNPKKNGLWLEIKDPEIQKYRMNYDGAFCLVEGTVNANNHGRVGGWAGAIDNITRFEYQRASEKYIQA